jgi:trk system potassium uptake protein TrkH
MKFFNSLIYSLGTAGTGGFAMDSYSLEFYSAYSQYVIAIFMFIFGINFSMFYLLLVGNLKSIFKNEEVKAYFIIVGVSVVIITINIFNMCSGFEEAFRTSLFQVTSIISTTGFSTTNFIEWPALSLLVLMLLTFCGACAGSTAGGIKLSRVIILAKSFKRNIKKMIAPRKVETIKMNGKTIEEKQVESVQGYLVVYFIVMIVCTILISFDGNDLFTNLSASLTCINNVGPGLTQMIGPYGSFVDFSSFSKLVLTFEMIAGRLEIFPLLILFYPRTWLRK